MESNSVFALFVFNIVVGSSFKISCLNVPGVETLISWLVIGLFVPVITFLSLFICSAGLETALLDTLFCFLFLQFKFLFLDLETICVEPRMNCVHDLLHHG